MRVLEEHELPRRDTILLYVEDCEVSLGEPVYYDGCVWLVRGVGYECDDRRGERVTEILLEEEAFNPLNQRLYRELPATDEIMKVLKGGNIMPKKDLTNKFQLNEIVYLYDSDGERVKGRIDRIYQEYGTVIYEVHGINRDPASIENITSYHRAEGALEKEDSDEPKIKYL